MDYKISTAWQLIKSRNEKNAEGRKRKGSVEEQKLNYRANERS